MERKWKNDGIINLGIFKPGQKKDFFFESFENLDIISIKPTCSGCTKVGKYKDNKIPVNYTAGSIPVHLKHVKEHIRTNAIIVTYANGDMETLSFVSKIVK